MAMNRVPWQRLRQEYLAGATYRQLAEKYGVAPATICRHSREEGWKAQGDDPAYRCRQMVLRLADTVEETMDTHTEPWSVKELKDLSALTRELVGLQKLLEEACAGEKEPDGAEELRIVLEGPLEAWGE